LANPFEHDPLFRLQNEETRNRLTAAILSLCESERLVFTLYYYEGLTTEEIALLADETASSVAQLHSSALLSLHTRLAYPRSEFPNPANRENLNGEPGGCFLVAQTTKQPFLKHVKVYSSQIRSVPERHSLSNLDIPTIPMMARSEDHGSSGLSSLAGPTLAAKLQDLLDRIRGLDKSMDAARLEKIAKIKKAIADGTYA
jgi:Sigma-70, region 4/Anti-sigma-28 factor, FlgM